MTCDYFLYSQDCCHNPTKTESLDSETAYMHTCVEVDENVSAESVEGFFNLLIALQNVRRCNHISLELLVFSHQLSKMQKYRVCKKWQTIT